MSSQGYDVVKAELLARPTVPMALDSAIPLAELPTPILLLDEAAMMRNVEKMAVFLEAKGKGFRPHAKTHKCPEIARRQMAAGAVGICAAKVSEAFVLVNAGIDKVLVTSAVLAPAKTGLLAELLRGVACPYFGDAIVIDDQITGFENLPDVIDCDDNPILNQHVNNPFNLRNRSGPGCV